VNSVAQLGRFLRYDDWANRETLASLERIEDLPSGALKILAHIVGAERLWHGRLSGAPKPAAVWPALTVGECRAGLDELSRLWLAYLEGLTEQRLTEDVSYVNSKGEPWTSSVEDVLTHVAFHSAHHRGQIATALRAAGHTPAYTDYIHAVRQHFVP